MTVRKSGTPEQSEPGQVSVPDQVARVCVGVGAASVAGLVLLVPVDAPPAAYTGMAAIGAAAITAVGVYFGRRTK